MIKSDFLRLSQEKKKALYEQDYYLWLTTNAQLLREGKLSDVDFANLVEEIEDMGRSEKRSVVSNLEILLMHLLKYKYQPKKRSNSWLYTIFEHRDRLEKAFQESPSLKPYFYEIFASCYATARKKAALETGLSINIFPLQSPFTPEETLDSDHLPDYFV